MPANLSAQLTVRELADHIRDQLIGALHVGHVRSGDRLPSIRALARDLGQDHRKVARAYRLLEAESLVQVRGRSGVVAAPTARLENGVLEETAEWLANVVWDGWKRRIAVPDLPGFIRRWTSSVRVRCAFVDSCHDALEAFGYELREELGLEVVPIWLDTLRSRDFQTQRGFPTQLHEADLVVTTIFNVATVRTLIAPLKKPIVVMTVHPQTVTLVTSHLRERPLTVVCVDPSFADRIRLQYMESHGSAHSLHTILADDTAAVARLDRSEPVLLTRAARDRLGDTDLKQLVPHSPTLSPASALEIMRLMIRLNSVNRA